MNRPRLERPLAVVVVVMSAGNLAACGSSTVSTSAALPSGRPGQGKPAVILGDKNFTEEHILGDLYAQALRAKGYTVHLRANIGPSEVIDSALTRGQIDLYPEYTGVVYQELAKINTLAAPGAPVEPAAVPRTAQQTYQGAATYEDRRGFKMLNRTPFGDADRIATTNAFAKAHGLVSMGDLEKLPSFTYGAPPENRTRYEGLLGMRQAYGLANTVFVGLPIGAQYRALASGQVNTIAVFTTDGQLARGSYTVLTDPKNIFGFQNVAPVVDERVLAREGPQFAQTLNAVSAKLTTQAIQAMNAGVVIDHQDPAAVAGRFLAANVLHEGH